MARPIPSNIPSVPPGPLDIKPRGSGASFVDKAVETLREKTYKYLMLGTISGSQRPASAEDPQPAVIQKPEAFKPEELFERPFFPSKPVPHPPNISPSSIPNPSPSVSVSAELPGYSSHLHNIPGFSAFRPVVSSTSQSPSDPMPPPPLPSIPASTPMFSAPTSMMSAPTSMFSSVASLMPVPMAMYSAPTSMFSSTAPMIPALPPMYSATAPMFSAATPIIPVSTSMMPPSTLPTLLAPIPMIPVHMIPTSMMPTLTAPTPMMPTSMMPTLTETTPMIPTSMMPTLTATTPMMPAPMMPAPMMPAPMMPAPMMPAPMMPAPMMPAPMMPAPMMPAPMMPAPTPMMPAPPPMQPAPTPVMPMMGTPAPLTTSQSMSLQTDTHNPDYQPFTITDSREPMELEKTFREEPYEQTKKKEGIGDDIPEQNNFEDNCAMNIIAPTLNSKPQLVESNMSITSLAQGSGGSVSISAPAPGPAGCTPLTMELRKPERFTLKTSIPISKIDTKSVSTPVDTVYQSGAVKKPVFNPAFPKEKERPKLEIQSNIVIKPATVNIETNTKEKPLASDREGVRNITTPPVVEPPLPVKPPPVAKPPPPVKSPPVVKPPPAAALLNHNNNITTLINAAEAINMNDGQFRVPEPKRIVQKDVKKKKQEDPSVSRAAVQKPKFKSKDTQPARMQKTRFKLSVAEAKQLKQQNIGETPAVARNLFAPRRDPNKPIPTHNQIIKKPVSVTKPNALPPPPAIIRQAFGDYKPKPNFPQKPPDGGEQKNLIVNQKNQNSKMVVTIQPNPQVLLQRTNFGSKNLQAPSRLSSQSNRNEVIADTSSKVVALKKLHQDNCDENDFENLITENQIYGSKIVVKEKSQVMQEDWRKTKDKQADPDWKKILKVGVRADTTAESKNVVLQPNFVYLSNVQFHSNLMMLRNPSKNICQTTDSTKMRVSSNENKTTEANISNNNNVKTNTVKIAKPQIISHREIHVLKSSNNVLQTLSNNNNKTEVVFQTNQKVIVSSQVVFQVPVAVTEPDNNNYAVIDAKTLTQKKEIAKQMETKPEKMFITCQVDAKLPKIVITSLRPKICTSPKALDEISTLDVYEQKKRLRRLKYLTNTNKDVPKVDPSPVKKVMAAKPSVNIITPENMNEEIFRELSRTQGARDGDSGTSDSGDSDEDELHEYRAILNRYGPHHNDNAKADFLAGFNLATKEVFRAKQLERHERTLRFDAVASAYLAASDLAPCEEAAASSAEAPATITWTTEDKSQFLAQFNLMQVSQRYKSEYEKSWQEILRERDRRNGVTRLPEAFDPDGELQALSAISRVVLHNNDRIKRRLDSFGDERSDIRILAEKNFSELNRLSKMADRSVKLFSGKESRKRDLNPGFDSENIKKIKIDPKKLPRIKIPDISKIISLKTDQVSSVESSSHATSMDEPRSSASCGARGGRTRDAGTQAPGQAPWPRAMDIMDHFIKEYREYEIARKREMGMLHRGNTVLRVECAHVTRAASHDSDRASALLAERRRLAAHEARLQASLELLTAAVQLIRMP